MTSKRYSPTIPRTKSSTGEVDHAGVRHAVRGVERSPVLAGPFERVDAGRLDVARLVQVDDALVLVTDDIEHRLQEAVACFLRRWPLDAAFRGRPSPLGGWASS